jgi:hypothetical protein
MFGLLRFEVVLARYYYLVKIFEIIDSVNFASIDFHLVVV